MALALGLAPHSGWAIAVVIDGRTVIDKQRIDVRRRHRVTQALAKDLKPEAESWKGAASSPWTADHRLAAAVALRSVGA